MSKLKKWKDVREDIVDGDAERDREIREGADAIVAQQALRALREARGRSQESLAAELGVSQANVSRIEHEEDLRVSTLRRYVRALGGDLAIVARFPDRDDQVILGHDGGDEQPVPPLSNARAKRRGRPNRMAP